MGIDWISRRSEAEALVAAGSSLADVAHAFGCSPNTASAGLRRLGLAIDPVAARERRAMAMSKIGSDPLAISKRTDKLKQTLAKPKAKLARSASAKRQWRNEDVRLRTIEGLRAAAATMTPEQRSARSAMAGASKMAWCPAEYREEYARLRRLLGSAREAKRVLLDHLATRAAMRRQPTA